MSNFICNSANAGPPNIGTLSFSASRSYAIIIVMNAIKKFDKLFFFESELVFRSPSLVMPFSMYRSDYRSSPMVVRALVIFFVLPVQFLGGVIFTSFPFLIARMMQTAIYPPELPFNLLVYAVALVIMYFGMLWMWHAIRPFRWTLSQFNSPRTNPSEASRNRETNFRLQAKFWGIIFALAFILGGLIAILKSI